MGAAVLKKEGEEQVFQGLKCFRSSKLPGLQLQ